MAVGRYRREGGMGRADKIVVLTYPHFEMFCSTCCGAVYYNNIIYI